MRQLLGDRENISGLFVVFVVFLVAGVRSNLGVGEVHSSAEGCLLWQRSPGSPAPVCDQEAVTSVPTLHLPTTGFCFIL